VDIPRCAQFWVHRERHLRPGGLAAVREFPPILELPSPLARAEQDNVLVVSGNSSGGITDTISSMMPMLMLVMMLGMIGPMLSGGSE
jgi:hypothetical protein